MRNRIASRILMLAFAAAVAACSAAEDPKVAGPSPAPAEPPSGGSTVVTKVFAYVGAQYTNLVYSFQIDKATGALNPTSVPSIAGGLLPMISTASLDKRFLLTANYSGPSVSVFAIDKVTGNLNSVQELSLGFGRNPSWIQAHPLHPIYYVANAGNSTIAILDQAEDGTLTLRKEVAAGAGVTSLVMNATGSALFSADQGADRVGVFSVTDDGELTPQASVILASGAQPNQVLLSSSGQNLYTANWGTNSVSAFSVSGTTLTSLGSDVVSGTAGVYMVALTPDGHYLTTFKPYGNEVSIHPILTGGLLGAATTFAKPGAVNVSFWKNHVYLLSWSNAAGGLPIETRTYTTVDGLSPTGTLSPDSYRGLYQMTIVEIPQD